jgi:hypothetical protein
MQSKTKRSNLIALIMCCSIAAATPPNSADARQLIPTFRLASMAKPSTCHTSDVAFEKLMSRHQHGHVYIVGRVVNNCDVDAGVQIKIAILDHAGGVLRVADLWPASTENIPAHSGWPFQAEMEGNDSFDRFQVSVLDVRRWTE